MSAPTHPAVLTALEAEAPELSELRERYVEIQSDATRATTLAGLVRVLQEAAPVCERLRASRAKGAR